MKVDMRRFTIDIIFFAVVCLQRMINMWEGNKRLNTMYEKCNNIVEMLTVITEGNMVSWERIGANEYKVPIARNYVALEYRKSEGFVDSPLTHLWGQAPR